MAQMGTGFRWDKGSRVRGFPGLLRQRPKRLLTNYPFRTRGWECIFGEHSPAGAANLAAGAPVRGYLTPESHS